MKKAKLELCVIDAGKTVIIYCDELIQAIANHKNKPGHFQTLSHPHEGPPKHEIAAASLLWVRPNPTKNRPS